MRAAPLSHFHVYASAAGLMGSAGQAPHSAANAWLDALAQWRRRLGVVGQSVAWGAVAEIGYAARHGADRRAEASGSGAISRDLAADALRLAMQPAACSFAVLPVDWPRLLADGRDAKGDDRRIDLRRVKFRAPRRRRPRRQVCSTAHAKASQQQASSFGTHCS